MIFPCFFSLVCVHFLLTSEQKTFCESFLLALMKTNTKSAIYDYVIYKKYDFVYKTAADVIQTISFARELHIRVKEKNLTSYSWFMVSWKSILSICIQKRVAEAHVMVTHYELIIINTITDIQFIVDISREKITVSILVHHFLLYFFDASTLLSILDTTH